jgi:hypothetical protein
MKRTIASLLVAVSSLTAVPAGATTSVLFLGNSLTFGRVDPVLSYNAANVRDLTSPANGGTFTNTTGANPYEPHPWGGVPGIFKMFTTQVGLDYDVAISARSGASLRGEFLNINNAGWDTRSTLSSQTWDQVVLQEQSDGPLAVGKTANASLGYYQAYASKISDYVRGGAAQSYTESQLFGSAAACTAATGGSATSCNITRTIGANANASAGTKVFLEETWARPDLVNGAPDTRTNGTTGAVTLTGRPGPNTYASLQDMTNDLHAASYDLAKDTTRFAGVAGVGDAFQLAVNQGITTGSPYGAMPATDGSRINLWFDDGLHANKYGSYLSALTLFGTLTGLDPIMLGIGERAATDLGISRADAQALQQIASTQFRLSRVSAVPEPASWAMMIAGFAIVGSLLRRRRSAPTVVPV